MFCSKCGKEIYDEAVICPNCGVPTNSFVQPKQFKKVMNIDKFNKELSVAKTLGLIATIGGIFSPLIGWICGAIGLSKISNLINQFGEIKDLGTARILNITGLAVGTINFFVSILIIIISIDF